MSCEIHDDSWHCYQHEGEWFHEKKESSEVKSYDGVRFKRFTRDESDGINKEDFKKAFPKTQFNPFGKIWDILNGEE